MGSGETGGERSRNDGPEHLAVRGDGGVVIAVIIQTESRNISVVKVTPGYPHLVQTKSKLGTNGWSEVFLL